MKWYSVKKYRPAIWRCMYLVRLESSEIFIATLESDIELTWISDDGKYFDDYDVTHFCIPDPIEIEE